MSNSIFAALARQKVNTFRSAFSELAKEIFYDEENAVLRHSAEFGAYRERLCADFLRMFMPSYLSVGSGFLINSKDSVSSQCDLIIYDPQYTPRIEDAENRRFYPVETVAAVGEVKSTLSRSDLLASLVKLSKAKSMRRGLEFKGSIIRRRFSNLEEEQGHHFDYTVSFLICDRFSFKLDDITSEIPKAYDTAEVDCRDRHNLVLSLNDGVLCYRNHLLNRDPAWMYPWTRDEAMKNRLVFSGENSRNHIGIFTAYFFMLCANATIYLPHIADYDTPQVEGIYQDEA